MELERCYSVLAVSSSLKFNESSRRAAISLLR